MAETTMTDHVIREAERLYHHDPVFHAQVQRTVDLLVHDPPDMPEDSGRSVTHSAAGAITGRLVTHSAAVALTVARMWPDGIDEMSRLRAAYADCTAELMRVMQERDDLLAEKGIVHRGSDAT